MLQGVVSQLGRCKRCIHKCEQVKQHLWKLWPKEVENVTDIEHVPESRWFITLACVVRTHCAQASGIWTDTGKAPFEAVLPELGGHGSEVTKSHHVPSFQGVFISLSPNTWGSVFPQRCLQPECTWELKKSSGFCSLSWVKRQSGAWPFNFRF